MRLINLKIRLKNVNELNIYAREFLNLKKKAS